MMTPSAPSRSICQQHLPRSSTDRNSAKAAPGYTDLSIPRKGRLIASAQISHTSKSFSKTMTMEQFLYAEKMAAEWLRQTQTIPTASVPDAPKHYPETGLAAASD
jgi:hypothetical protein